MKGILINYEYCTGCHSCEVACRNELGLERGEFGIKVTEVGPYKYETTIKSNTPYEWVFNPTITKACDLCEARTAMGKMPSCVQACQAWCMYYGEAKDLVKKMDGDTRWALYTPIQGEKRESAYYGAAADAAARAAKEKSAGRSAGTTSNKTTEAAVENTYHLTVGSCEVNVTLRNEQKLTALVEEYGAIDFAAAKDQVIEAFLANEKSSSYTLAAADAKDGADHELKYTGICMSYDAQGTQLGGGKAYLDKGQEIVKKDITIVFM